MDKGNPEGAVEKRRTGEEKAKRAYLQPAFRFERVFETQALSCGKIAATQKHCFFNRKSS